MNKSLVKKIVTDVCNKVGKKFNVEVTPIIEMEFDWSIDFKLKFNDKELLDRSVYIRNDDSDYRVNGGFHSPSHTKSDLLQKIIIGKVAEKLLIVNNKV